MTDRSTFCPGLTQRRFVLPPSRHHPSRDNLTAGSRALIPPPLRITRGAASAAVGTHGTGQKPRSRVPQQVPLWGGDGHNGSLPVAQTWGPFMMATCPIGFIILDSIFTGMRPLDPQTTDPRPCRVPLPCSGGIIHGMEGLKELQSCS